MLMSLNTINPVFHVLKYKVFKDPLLLFYSVLKSHVFSHDVENEGFNKKWNFKLK